MVDKIRKLGAWFLANVWRLTLLFAVGYLCYQVYMVLRPPAPPTYRRLMPPNTIIEDVPPEGMPPAPPVPPPLDITGGYNSLVRANPFWYHSNRGAQKEGGADPLKEMGVKLERIQEVNGRLRAQIRTASTKKWYDEGEQFEEFELREINEDEGLVKLYLTRDGNTYTLRFGE